MRSNNMIESRDELLLLMCEDDDDDYLKSTHWNVAVSLKNDPTKNLNVVLALTHVRIM